jgi:tRNA A-37 threonylcarbamoyl transferase component Bud32
MSVESYPGPPSLQKQPAQSKRPKARYEVQEQLASGGMGVVYCVLDRSVGELRAMKRVSADHVQREFALKALEHEYQVLASLDHPHIIRVFDYGVDELGPYYTMEYLEGQDMRELAPLDFKQACYYLREIAASLALLHARHLVYRDLSPTNIRITKDGHCKLIDFGALTSFGHSPVVVGTLLTIAPEVIGGAPLDQRADLYSLGAVAYWMLTGRHAIPAHDVAELSERWGTPPSAPSSMFLEIPPELDELVLSLLRTDPLARPASAAEVIARLEVIGDLPAEFSTQAERTVQRFLLSPRFTGRVDELDSLAAMIAATVRGRGSTVCIQSVPGMGRSRLLDEIGVRGQLAGATVIRADAGMFRQRLGTIRALALRLYEAAPELARECGIRYRSELTELGPEIEARFASLPPAATRTSSSAVRIVGEGSSSLEGWFAEISRAKPLVILVDNLEYADQTSIGLLALLAKMSAENPLFIAITARVTREPPSASLAGLHTYSNRIELKGLNPSEMLALLRSLFADAPNVERFAEWLHETTAGSPLYAVEICRQLAAQQVIRYCGDIWTLPLERPDAQLPPGLSDALSVRLDDLSEPARSLAECLSLQLGQPTLELCEMLSEGLDQRQVLHLLDELARNDVLYSDSEGLRFSSTALREVLLGTMDELRLEKNHRRLGEAFAKLIRDHDLSMHIDAGWHLIQGADELRGAEMIASVTQDYSTMRKLAANLPSLGPRLEAALNVYNRYRRSVYERMPLLATLAQAGYYEERTWGDRYGDHALDVLEEISGLGKARGLRPLFGRWLALIIGVGSAYIRFRFSKRRGLKYSFDNIVLQLLATVTTVTGVASLSLDSQRARRVAEILEPFDVLPERWTPAGIYHFCRGVREIGVENPALAFETFETLLRHFEDPTYYRMLPTEARKLYLAAIHFARGSFAIFRAHGEAALQSADRLEELGLKLYSVIANQIRFLYFTMRGEFSAAALYHQQVELHAAHLGATWQVETWEAPALMIVHLCNLSDIVASTRIAERIELMSRAVPSLKLYSRIARRGLMLARRDDRFADAFAAEFEPIPPRSFIGWTATMGMLARGYNELGKHAEAKAVCERTLSYVTDADLEFVALFSTVEIEMAIAQAGLGRPADGLELIDRLLKRFSDHDHPLFQGLLHEARARIAWSAHMTAQYATSLAEVGRRYRLTGASSLIARYDRLARLGSTNATDNALTSQTASTAQDADSEDFRMTEVVAEPSGVKPDNGRAQ